MVRSLSPHTASPPQASSHPRTHQSSEQALLVGFEQVETPIDRAPQRLLAVCHDRVRRRSGSQADDGAAGVRSISSKELDTVASSSIGQGQPVKARTDLGTAGAL